MSLRSVTLIVAMIVFFFFFSSRRRHTRWPRDWSSDVCSSDLLPANQCTNGIGIGSLRHQPRAKPMIEVACLILEQQRRSVVNGDENIEGAVVVEIPNRHAARRIGP